MGTLETVIAGHAFLKGLDPRFLPLLVEGAALVRFPAGEKIAQEGEEAHRFYLLLSGKVALEALIPAQGQVGFQTLGAGEALGWSWLFPPFRWHFTARAIEDTEAVAWDTAQLRARSEANPQFGYELSRRMTSMLLDRLRATTTQLVDFYPPTG